MSHPRPEPPRVPPGWRDPIRGQDPCLDHRRLPRTSPTCCSGGIPLRPLGKTGEMVSLLCLGGHSSTNPQKLSEKESLALIQRAVDEGITFMDNCWDYHDGGAEEWMGKALAEGGRRDKVFLMTKVCGRTAQEAESNLHDSLKRLKTDRLDLWQFHEMVYDNDPDWVFEPDGAIEAGLKAIKEGKVRFLGFTGHKDPLIHLKMLGKPYDWASVQMPINVMDAHFRSFQHNVLPVLLQRTLSGVLAMKSLGGNGSIVSKAGVSVEDTCGTSFLCPVSTLVSGIDSEKVLDQNLKIVREFKPVTAEERALRSKTVHLKGRGRRPFRAVQVLEDVRRPSPSQAWHGFDTAVS